MELFVSGGPMSARRGAPALILGVGLAALLPLTFFLLGANLAGAAVVSVPLFLGVFFAFTLPLERALLAWLVVYFCADACKRAVFLFGDENPQAQYLPLTLGFAALFIIGCRGLYYRYRFRRLDNTDRFFLVFLAFLSLGVIISPSLSLKAKAMLLPLSVGPYLMFLAYREANRVPGWRDKFCRRLTKLGVIATAIGVSQVIIGLLPWDKAWLESSQEFSVAARTLAKDLEDGLLIRPYSFFADHFTFGYFLVAALVALALGKWPARLLPRAAVAVFLLTGLAFARTRAAWLGLALALLALLAGRVIRLRTVMPALILAAYVALTAGLGLVYDKFFPDQVFDSRLSAQVLSVGTLSERGGAAETLGAGLARYLLVGDAGEVHSAGWVKAKFSNNLEEEAAGIVFSDSHNYLINLLATAGLPGLLAFLFMFARVFSRGWRLQGAELCAVAAAGGLFLAGAAASHTMLSGFFLAWCAFALTPPAAPAPAFAAPLRAGESVQPLAERRAWANA